MATTTKNYNAWDLSNGMDVDYSGSAERKKADEEYARAQKIVADAYEIDSYSATAQSNADKINSENLAYLNTIQGKTNALNADNLFKSTDFTDKTSTLNAANSFEALFSEEQRVPVTSSNQINTEQSVVDTAIKNNVVDAATPQAISELPNNNKNVIQQNNAVQNVEAKDKQLPQQTIRQRTNLEVLQAVEQRATGKTLYEVQKRIKQEHINNAAGGAYYNPMASLDALRKAGVSVPVELKNTGDGNYIQTLPDGKSINLTRLDVGVMVNDIIFSTRTMMARDEKAIIDAKAQSETISEEQRKLKNNLIEYQQKSVIDLNKNLQEREVANNYDIQQRAIENSYKTNSGASSSSQKLNTEDIFSGKTQPVNNKNSIVPDSQRLSLIQRESSGDYKNMKSPIGYIGAYQFGTDRLAQLGLVKEEYAGKGNSVLKNPDAWKIEGGLNRFLNDKDLQDNTYTKSYEVSKNYIINRLPEKDKNNQLLIAGLIRGAHLAGDKGIMDAYESNWKDNPSDKNKTRYKSYFDEGIAIYNESNPNKNLLLPIGVDRVNASKIVSSNVENTKNKYIPRDKAEIELSNLDKQSKIIKEATRKNQGNFGSVDTVLEQALTKKRDEIASRQKKLGGLIEDFDKKMKNDSIKKSEEKAEAEANDKIKKLLESIK